MTKTLTTSGENLSVILLGQISHPPHTRMEARILGGVKSHAGDYALIAVPLAEEKFSLNKQNFPFRMNTDEQLRDLLGLGSQTVWLSEDELESLIQDAKVRYYQAEMDAAREEAQSPAWHPVDRDGRVVGYTETEHYTDAEYTYFKLPYRFQYYMDQHLADDERIMFALSRPSLRSERERTWFGKKKLNEGVLILTTQRLILLVELIPPERSAVRYGFVTQMGAIERLRDFKVDSLGNENILLKSFWAAEGGTVPLEFELSRQSVPEIGELQHFLDRIIADTKSSCALRRIPAPKNPDELPVLKDLSSNDPEDLKAINKRFSELLPSTLRESEKAVAWALWPDWFEKKGYSRVLLVTDQSLRILLDPAAGSADSTLIQHKQIATLQYSASILESSIGFTTISDGKVETRQHLFPFPAANTFQQCFEALRRHSASVPFNERDQGQGYLSLL